MSKTLKREACTYCGSANNVCFYTNSFGKEVSRCMTPNCEYNNKDNSVQQKEESTTTPLITVGQYEDLSKRCITKETCEAFQYKVANISGRECHIEHHYNLDNELTAQKIRVVDVKKFSWHGNTANLRLGQPTKFHTDNKDIAIICEGAIDAMSVYQTLFDYPNIDVYYLTGGAGDQTKSELIRNKSLLNQYNQLIFCLDNDEAGQEAIKQSVSLFDPYKVYTVSLRYKDPNEYLQQDKASELKKDILEYKIYTPPAIKVPTKEQVFTPRSVGRPFPEPRLNEALRGLKPGRLYMLLAGPKAGKSTLTKNWLLHWLEADDKFTAAVAYLEEPIEDSALSLTAMSNKIPPWKFEELLGKEDVNMAPYDKYINSERVGFLDASFMKLEGKELLYNLNWLATVGKYPVIILDHITMITYDMGREGSERKDIDVLMKQLRQLAFKTNVSFIVVCHLKRPGQGLSWDQGRPITMSDGRSSGAYEQLCDVMIGIERNLQDEIEKNKTKLKVLANRITGITGYMDTLYYREDTGRLVTIDQVFK